MKKTIKNQLDKEFDYYRFVVLKLFSEIGSLIGFTKNPKNPWILLQLFVWVSKHKISKNAILCWKM